MGSFDKWEEFHLQNCGPYKSDEGETENYSMQR